MAIGAIWGEIWGPIWNTAIWSQDAVEPEPEPAPQAEPEVFTGGFVYAFERERARRERERREQLEREEEARQIEEETTRQIALLLREQEAKDARRAELARLSDLVARFAGRGDEAALSPRVEKALRTAAAKQTAWALFQLERELARAHEEEQFILEALRIALDS